MGAAPAPANVFAADGADPRVFLTPAHPAWRRLWPVGVVASEFTLPDRRGIGEVAPGLGTAFLVSPCYAITSYHVLFGSRDLTLNPMAAYPVTIGFGLGGGRPVMTVKGRAIRWDFARDPASDIALIRLDGCPGRRLGWYALATGREGDDLTQAAVTMASVSRDRSLNQASVGRCRLHGAIPARGWVLHDCATRKGASGAPLIVRMTGVPMVIGINAGEIGAAPGIRRNWDPDHANWAVATAWVGRDTPLNGLIARDVARGRTVNPLSGS